MALFEWRWCWPRLSELSSAMICTDRPVVSYLATCGPAGRRPLIRTQHVALAVLAALAVGNVGLHAEVDEREVLDGEHVGLDAPHEAEAAAMVHVAAGLVEPSSQDRKGKVVA